MNLRPQQEAQRPNTADAAPAAAAVTAAAAVGAVRGALTPVDRAAGGSPTRGRANGSRCPLLQGTRYRKQVRFADGS